MPKRFRKRPSPGAVLAMVALLVALGGTAVAAREGARSGAKPAARAYAFVRSSGKLVDSKSSGIKSVKFKPTAGYCVTPDGSSGIDAAKEFPVVSGDYFDATGFFNSAEFDSNASGTSKCPKGWMIYTYYVGNTAGDTGHSAPGAFSLIAP